MSPRRAPAVGPLLESLYAAVDWSAQRQVDPVSYVHRYREPADREVAGLLSSGLAFGRVAAFRPVLDEVFAVLDAHGGPARVARRTPNAVARALEPLFYRWIRGPHLVALIGAAGEVQGQYGSLEPLQAGGSAADGLTRLVDALRAGVEDRTGLAFSAQPRGLRYLLPRPHDGSACKRLCMFHRWMVRPDREGIDFGLWARDPATLVVPVDTHVLRLARFLGLTSRQDGSWRTAQDITESLRALDPVDPVRFDFALAHLGISGACRGYRVSEVCQACPLDRGCMATSRRG